jgi:hypothetical protein
VLLVGGGDKTHGVLPRLVSPPTGYKNSSKLGADFNFFIEIKYSKRRNKTVFYFDLATFA